jgi:ribosomal-protein-alanine N-acetyltransferase
MSDLAMISTGRLVLQPLVKAHAQPLFAGLREPRLYDFIPREPPKSPTEVEARFARLERRRSPEGNEAWLNWAAWCPAVAAHVGLFEATARSDGRAWIAYFVFAPYQRQGYGREAVGAVVEHLFSAHGVETVHAEIDTRNAASIRLVEELGFERVEIVRNADWFKGAPSDEFRFALPRDRFPGR